MIYLWIVGVAFTTLYHGYKAAEDGVDTDTTGLLQIFWLSSMSLLWPAYWAGKMIMAPIDRLMLPPGEGM